MRELLEELKISPSQINRSIWVICVILILIWLLSGIYQVNANEVGLLQYFGALQPYKVQPGIHYRPPWPIGKVDKIKITEVKSMDVGFYLGDDTFLLETLIPYCITGDVNIIHNRYTIQYRISDPAAYKFHHSSPDALLMTLAKSTIIKVIGDKGVDPVLTSAQRAVAEEIRVNLQKEIDAVNLGVSITSIDTKMVAPPENVKRAFQDVITAQSDKTTAIHNAENYRNREIPAANAEANRLKENAEAYKSSRMLMAEGEAKRFMNLYEEYRRAPDVTRNRLFLQMVEEILPRVKVVVLATDSKGNPIKIKLVSGAMPTKPIIPEIND